MKSWRIAALALLLLGGCMRTRHIDLCQRSDGDGCDTVYNERRWLGFWPCCPSKVEP